MAIGYNMTSVNPSQWADMINAIESGTYPDEIKVTNNQTQWDALIGAIGQINGKKWTKVASDVKQIAWGSFDCDDVLCIVKQTVGQKPATTFILPYSTMGMNIPIVDGLYYNNNYYYSFGIQSGATNLYVQNSWCRGYESGTVISSSDFVMDVYIR